MAVVEDLPTGKVVGQYLFVSQDTRDEGSSPNSVLVKGYVRFTCSASPPLIYRSRKVSAVPLVHDAIFDSQGFLIPMVTGVTEVEPGKVDRGLELLAPSPELNPPDFTWMVSFHLTEVVTGRSINIPSFPIRISAGEVRDLTDEFPVGASKGTLITRGESAYEVAVAEGFTGTQAQWIESLGGTGGEGTGSTTRIRVVTGNEVRPDTDFVIWLGGRVRPTQMIEGDIWFAREPAPVTPPVISTTVLNSMVVNAPFTQLLAASGVGPFTWSATGLPAGLTMAADGSLTGTPASTGSGSATITVTSPNGSANKQFSWTVAAGATSPVVLSSPAMPAMSVGVPFTWTPGRSGSTPMTWGVSVGALPVGLAINSSTGAVSGTPTAAGAFAFTLRAVNSAGNGIREFTGTIADAPEQGGIVNIFGDTTPGAPSSHTDADAGSWLAHQFYVPASGPSLASASIVGARLYVPVGSSLIGQTWRIGLVRLTGSNPLLRVGGNDFGGQGMLTTNGAMTVGPALVAGWNELLFSQEWPGITNGEGVIIGAMIGDGRYYLFDTTLPATAIPSTANLQLAEAGTTQGEIVRSFYRGMVATGGIRWYGLDIMVRTA